MIGNPRRTTVERSAIDAASWSRNERTACGLVAAVVQQRLSTGPRLLKALDAAGPIRFRRSLRFALYDISGGAQALSEIDFAKFCRKHRLGTVIRQVVRRDAAGRRRYLDILIESPSGIRLACEIDGALHLVVATYWQDMFRANELLIVGQPLMRFPSFAVRAEEAVVADQIRRAFHALEEQQLRQAS
jgi:very-short-patch-repair endonuclease